jgi:hypothetical protein
VFFATIMPLQNYHIKARKLVDVAKALKIKSFLFYIEYAYQKTPEELKKAFLS